MLGIPPPPLTPYIPPMSLTASIWVSAYLARLRAEGIPAVVAAKGDPTAGAVMVRVSPMDGTGALYQRRFDLLSGERRWDLLATGTEAEIDAAVARQRGFDRDLWVIDVEDPRGRHLLDDPGLSA